MNWYKFRPLYLLISLAIIVPGVWSLLTYGLRLNVDFTGGSQITVSLPADQTRLVEIAKENLGEVETSLEGDKLTLSAKPIDQNELDRLQADWSNQGIDAELLSFVTVGPSAGRLLLRQTLLAAAVASIAIMVFISRAFKSLKYGVCAVLAMLHDTLVLLGSFSLLGHFLGIKVDLLFVTAVLTVLSFSVHDTIVLFARAREIRRLLPHAEYVDIANKAVTDAMVRSLNNSMTIIFMLLALVLLGGETIRWFAVALLIGAITGTYSSPFVAVPLVTFWTILEDKRH